MYEITKTGPYMPKSDKGKRQWMANFITNLELDLERYGIEERYFAYVKDRVQRFIKASEAAAVPQNRNGVLTAGKNEARAEAVQLCRELAMKFKANPAYSDSERVALGIHIDAERPKRSKGKLRAPSIRVSSSPDGGHIIKFSCGKKDAASSSSSPPPTDDLKAAADTKSKAKPAWASHLLLFACVGEKGAKGGACARDARLLGAYTKQPIGIDYPMGSGVEGKCATYWARWLTGTGEIGPWSKPASMIIAAARGSAAVPFAHLFVGVKQEEPNDEGADEIADARELKLAA